MKSSDDSGIRQHKRLAMGESIGDNFGVEPIASHAGRMATDTSSSAVHGRVMDDGERTQPRANGRGRSQANPDHGPVKY